MDTNGKIACCKICLLAENMKDCKACQFSIGLFGPQPTPQDYRIFKGTMAEFFEDAVRKADAARADSAYAESVTVTKWQIGDEGLSSPEWWDEQKEVPM